MKRLIKTPLLLVTFFIVGCTTSLNSQSLPSYVPTQGLKGWWPFNGSAIDESNNGDHGNTINVSLTEDRFGNCNSAYNFYDITSDILLNNNHLNSFTFVAWVKVFDLADTSMIFSKGDHCDFQNYSFSLDLGYHSAFIELYTDQDTYYLSASAQYADSTWHHVAVTFEQSLIQLYLDGTLMNSKATQGNLKVSTSKRSLGGDICTGYPMKGDLDDVGLWNRALSQTEITQLYTANATYNPISYNPNDETVNVNENAEFLTYCLDTSVNYQWQTDLGSGFQNLVNGGQYADVTEDTLKVMNATLANHNQPFRCIVTTGNCSDTSDVAYLFVNDDAGIDNVLNNNLNIVFPNPVKDQLTIKLETHFIGEKYKIYNLSGKVVTLGKITSELTKIQLEKLSEGTYTISIGDNLHQTFEIVKE